MLLGATTRGRSPLASRHARRLALAAFGALALLGLLAYFLVVHYRSSHALRENLIAQRAQEARLHAVALGNLLDAAFAAVRNVAVSSEVDAFFKNRDLGMSMEYGLRLSLVPIAERFRATVAGRGPTGLPVLARLVCLARDAEVLSRESEPDELLAVLRARSGAAYDPAADRWSPVSTVNAPAPTLGNYPATTMTLSAQTTVTPSAAPTGATSIVAAASSGFNGTFYANPATGAVSVINAHPAGTFTVTVKAFGPGGMRAGMIRVQEPDAERHRNPSQDQAAAKPADRLSCTSSSGAR